MTDNERDGGGMNRISEWNEEEPDKRSSGSAESRQVILTVRMGSNAKLQWWSWGGSSEENCSCGVRCKKNGGEGRGRGVI